MRNKIATVLALLVLSIVGAQDTGAASPHKDRSLTIMTRNMDLGSDFSYIFAAVANGGSPLAVLQAITATYVEVVHSDMPGRAQALADEIEATQPDLIALQEVNTIRNGAPGQPPALVADQLDLLLDALASRGLHYEVAAVQTNLDVTIPSLVGMIQVTDHDVVLARSDLPVSLYQLERVSKAHFVAAAPLSLLGVTIPVTRGWIALDVKLRGKPYRFVTTHLEPDLPGVQAAEVTELLAGPLATEVPVILAGDLNSDAYVPTGSEPAYPMLIAGGWTDVWAALKPSDAGLTWPMFAEDVPLGPGSPLRRIDLVLTKGSGIRADAVALTGTTPPYASDHAGVVAKFTLLP